MAGRSISRAAATIGTRCAAALFLWVASAPASADAPVSCAAYASLLEVAATGTDPGDPAALAQILGADRCGTAMALDGTRAIHCRWMFDYRAPEAEMMRRHLASGLKACLRATAVAAETGVNHPDSYDQQRFRAEGAELSLSLKDKAALDKSFVFLRVGGR